MKLVGQVMSEVVAKRSEREELFSLLRILDEQEKLADDNKLDRYVPHGKGEDGGQIAFHQSPHKIRLLITGNRFGKSTCANVIEPIWLATGTHPYRKSQLPIPNRGKIYADSFSMVMQNLAVKFEEWLPKRMLAKRKPYVYDQRGMLAGINFANGSFIHIGSYDQETRKSEGSNWHYVGYDEPPPRDLYIANLRGLIDFGGLTWIAATPLSEAWIYDDLWMPGLTGKKPYIKCIRGKSSDNPNINQKHLELFLEELTDEEKEIRFHGNFAKLMGLVIDTYDPAISDIDDFELNGDYALYEGIDPHSNKPHTALWKAIHRNGDRFVVDELSCAGSIREFGEQISLKRRALQVGGAKLIKSVSDTSLNQNDGAYRINLRLELCDALRQCGEGVMPFNAQKRDQLHPGIQRLRDLYRVVDKDDGSRGPTQYVFKRCKHYRYELRHYQWPDGINRDDVKPVSKHNDFIDPDRYIESVAPIFETPGSRFIKVGNEGAYRRMERC